MERLELRPMSNQILDYQHRMTVDAMETEWVFIWWYKASEHIQSEFIYILNGNSTEESRVFFPVLLSL